MPRVIGRRRAGNGFQAETDEGWSGNLTDFLLRAPILSLSRAVLSHAASVLVRNRDRDREPQTRRSSRGGTARRRRTYCGPCDRPLAQGPIETSKRVGRSARGPDREAPTATDGTAGDEPGGASEKGSMLSHYRTTHDSRPGCALGWAWAECARRHEVSRRNISRRENRRANRWESSVKYRVRCLELTWW